MDSSHYQENGRFEKGSFTMITACPRAPRDEKNRGKKWQTDPRGEDKKEKQHIIKLRILSQMTCIFHLFHSSLASDKYYYTQKQKKKKNYLL